MRAAIMTAVDRLELLDIDVDAPADDEVLVDVVASGLCHSDVTLLGGRMPGVIDPPKVLGHEVAGVVRRVGRAVTEFVPGDFVTGCNSRRCGRCRQCLEGRGHLCVNRGVIERPRPRLALSDGTPVGQVGQLGGFAEQVLTGEDTLVKLPKDFPLDRAALLGCAVITGAGSVLFAAKVRPGSTVVVFGCGGVGLNAVQAAAICGARQVIALDVSEEKLDLARLFGATHTFNAREADLTAIRELTNGGADYVFDCVGSARVVHDALRVLAPGCTAYLVGVPGVGVSYEFPASETVLSGKGLQGVLMGSNNFKRDIPILADLYLQGRLKLDELVGDRISIDELQGAMDRIDSGSIARTLVMQ